MIDPCVHCGNSTAFGSGRFVNRIGHGDGWACAACMSLECDRCNLTISLDEDIVPEDCGLLEFSDGADRVCSECLTENEVYAEWLCNTITIEDKKCQKTKICT